MTNWILGEKFNERYDHLDSIQALWEKKWKFPATISVYPFHDGKYEDFEKVFDQLIKNNIHDAYSDDWTKTFMPVAEDLTKQAEQAESSDPSKASELYKRASVVYRISRFPIINTDLKREANERQKEVYLKSASFWDVPIKEVVIPHTQAAGKDGKEIPLYVRTPPGASADKPVPTMLLMTGLDGYRPDNTVRTDEFLKRGWATVIAEIPGTADCPSEKRDPASPDRLWTAILDWMAEQKHFNMRKICAWGLSMGGYYAIRAAHTHKDHLAGCCAQGAGTHHFFGKEWLDKADQHEYPFTLTPAMALKFGYDSVEEMKEKIQKEFSLVETGIVKMPSTRLLLVNGTWDGLMPIEDSMLLFEYGNAKEGRFYSKLPHMGYPPANESVYPWLEQVMATAT